MDYDEETKDNNLFYNIGDDIDNKKERRIEKNIL